MKKLNRTFLGLVGFLFMLMNSSAHSIVNWPTGPSPCNDINDLESCLNGVSDGEIVEIRANAIPSQSGISVSPAKSFTLRAASGFTPVFASFTSLTFIGSDDDITVVIEGITIQVGNILGVQAGMGTFNVTYRDNVLEDSLFRNALEIRSGNSNPPYGPVIFLIEGNILTVEDETVSGIYAGGFQGNGNQGTISNNLITATNTGQASTILATVSSASYSVDIIGNEINGQGFNSGIDLRLSGSGGFLNSRIINNTISGQVSAAGHPAGISMTNSSNGFGHSGFLIINNTIAYNESGISLRRSSDINATHSMIIKNNIVAFNSQTGLNLGSSEPWITNDYNLIFDNTNNFYTPGINDIEQDPLLVSNVDFQLQSLSPALNAGLNSAVPEDILTDIDGNMRIHQQDVDMGAYESSVAIDVIFKNTFE